MCHEVAATGNGLVVECSVQLAVAWVRIPPDAY